MVTIPAVMAASAWAIARYRGYGALASVLLGWGILVAVYSIWPAPPGQWDEDREEMPSIGPFAMAMWCLPVWGAIELWLWLRRRTRRSA